MHITEWIRSKFRKGIAAPMATEECDALWRYRTALKEREDARARLAGAVLECGEAATRRAHAEERCRRAASEEIEALEQLKAQILDYERPRAASPVFDEDSRRAVDSFLSDEVN